MLRAELIWSWEPGVSSGLPRGSRTPRGWTKDSTAFPGCNQCCMRSGAIGTQTSALGCWWYRWRISLSHQGTGLLYHISFIHPSAVRLFIWLHNLALLSSVAIHMPSLWCASFEFFGCVPRSGIAVSFGSSVLSFSRNFCTIYDGFNNFTVPTTVCESVPKLALFLLKMTSPVHLWI